MSDRQLWVLLLSIFVAGSALARGLACGNGAMTPMEARLERASGDKSAQSTRIQNAQRASSTLKDSVPEARSPGDRVTTVRIKTGCCKSVTVCKQTVAKGCCKGQQTNAKGCCKSQQTGAKKCCKTK